MCPRARGISGPCRRTVFQPQSEGAPLCALGGLSRRCSHSNLRPAPQSRPKIEPNAQINRMSSARSRTQTSGSWSLQAELSRPVAKLASWRAACCLLQRAAGSKVAPRGSCRWRMENGELRGPLLSLAASQVARMEGGCVFVCHARCFGAAFFSCRPSLTRASARGREGGDVCSKPARWKRREGSPEGSRGVSSSQLCAQQTSQHERAKILMIIIILAHRRQLDCRRKWLWSLSLCDRSLARSFSSSPGQCIQVTFETCSSSQSFLGPSLFGRPLHEATQSCISLGISEARSPFANIITHSFGLANRQTPPNSDRLPSSKAAPLPPRAPPRLPAPTANDIPGRQHLPNVQRPPLTTGRAPVATNEPMVDTRRRAQI